MPGFFHYLGKLLLLILAIGICSSPASYAREEINTNSGISKSILLASKQPDGAMIEINAWWFAAKPVATSGVTALSKHPAVVLLHGCGGPLNARGELSQRFREYAALMTAQGYHALIVDSLKARGEKELCTQKIGTRRVTQAHRELDALAALNWLAAQPEVDAQRLALVGWSNGGSTVLAATNRARAAVNVAGVKPRAAVAFYPGCSAELKRGYSGTAPLLMMVGELDDWTPPEACKLLASREQEGERVQLEVMQGAYHGFDGAGDVRVREDVPNGAKRASGASEIKGVHVGGDAQARALSRVLLQEFLRRELAGG
jgi:dienelactone hydrolase